MATPRRKYDSPFNPRIPPLFSKGGPLYKARNLGAKIAFMVEMPADHFSLRQWRSLHDSARTELALLCFLEQRCATYSEMSQLDWLHEAGHKLYLTDSERPRCNTLAQIDELKTRIATLEAEKLRGSLSQQSHIKAQLGDS